MPLGVPVEGWLDLFQSTWEKLPRLKFSMIAQRLQRYEIMPMILRKDHVKMSTGAFIGFRAMFKVSTSARAVGLAAKDVINFDDFLTNGSVPWRNVTTNYPMEAHLVSMNSEPEKILDMVEVNRIAMLMGLAGEMEGWGWGKPLNNLDLLTPYGLSMYIVPNIAAAAGFNGGNPAGFVAGAGNISSITFPGWMNWTDTYTDPTYNDLVRAMRNAWVHTGFDNPVPIPEYKGRGERGIYTDYDTQSFLADVLRTQNDNLGRDLAWSDKGDVMFHGTPVKWIPYLDTAHPDWGAHPVVMVDWSHMYMEFLRGWHMKETKPEKVADQHTVAAVHVDNTYNMFCDNRSAQAIISHV